MNPISPIGTRAVLLCVFAIFPASFAAGDDLFDIAIDAVELAGDRVGPDEPIVIDVTVANRGPAAARGLVLATFLRGTKIGETPLGSLEAGEAISVKAAVPQPHRPGTVKVVFLVRPPVADLGREMSFANNGQRIALELFADKTGRSRVRSVMWLTEPLYVVDMPFRIEPWVSKVPLLVMIVNELPNEEGWDPDLDTFNSIKLWVNGVPAGNLENSFSVPNTRFWARLYELPISLFSEVNDFNLVRVNLDRTWADDRGPDIQPGNSAWGQIIDPMNGQPLDDATWLSDGDYWYCRVFRSFSRLPNVDRQHWFLGDTHYHTVYTDNGAEMGSPLYPTAYAGFVSGLNWLAVTDHSNDYDSDEDAENFKDGLAHDPFTRPQPRSVAAKWADFLDQVAAVNGTGLFSVIAGSEVNYAILKEDFPGVPEDIFCHALVYGLESLAVPIKGEGQDGMSLLSPIGKDAEEGASGNIPATNTSVYTASRTHGDTYTMAELLDFLQTNVPDAAVFLAHPIDEFDPDSVSWTMLKQRDPWYEEGGSFVYEAGISGSYHHPLFKGFEFWNGQPCFGNGIGKDTSQIAAGLAKYDSILQLDLPAFDPSKKLFFVGGSDGHGDFNSHTSRGEQYNWNILQKRRDLVHVLGKVRTAVYIPDGDCNAQSALGALSAGRAVATNGPMAVLTILHDGREYYPGDHLSLPRSELPGLGLRFRWATSSEFGPFNAVTLKVVGPAAVTAPIVLSNIPNVGERTVTIQSTLPAFSGWYALRVEATTDATQALYQEPGTTYPYRCLTNPIWLEITEG